MKLNKRFYMRCETNPYAVYKTDNDVSVELHLLNDNPFYGECIQKQRFSVWSTADGKTYKVFFEQGYYDIMKDLYDEKCCKEWIHFWEEIEAIKKKFILTVLLPVILVFYGAVFVIGLLADKASSGSGTMVILAGGVIGLILLYFLTNKILTKRMKRLNYEVVQKIKKSVGSKKFDQISRDKKKYEEKFYRAMYYGEHEGETKDAEVTENKTSENVQEIENNASENVQETETNKNK